VNQTANLPANVAADSPKTIANTQLAKGGVIEALVPQSLDDTFRLAKALAGAGEMIPKHFQGKPDAVMAAIVRGMEIGLAPMQSLSNIAVINGRASLWGDALPALMQRAGNQIDVIYEGEGDDLKAVATLTRGDTGQVVVREFSVEDAKKAGLWTKQGPWQQYPKRMLSNRARSWAVRDGAADALMGLQVAEEVQDYQPMRNVTPAPATGGFAAKAIEAKSKAQEQVEPANEKAADNNAEATDETEAETEQELQGLAEYQAGQNAAAEGFDRSECPHTDNADKAKSWIAGYDNAAEGGEE